MEILLWIYFIGLGGYLGFGLVLLAFCELLSIEPKDSTILKYIAFAIGWPVTYPVWMAVVAYQDRRPRKRK